METRTIAINNHTTQAISIPLPNAKLILIKGSKGYLMCGYLNIEKAEQLNDCAAIIPGVNTIEDMLDKKITAITRQAKALGINIGMTGREATEIIA